MQQTMNQSPRSDSRQTCSVSGRTFEVSDTEMEQRKYFGLESPPETAPEVRVRTLGAFWPHFYLHERTCDKTGKKIVSIFSEHCPYPVWHKDEWMKEANPPGAVFDASQDVFPQMWEFFQKSPIPHNTGVGNENCEYADDWWYSRHCYLCHSGFECENLTYCYRARKCNDCQYLAFATDCELCVDVINSHKCFNVTFALNCQQITDSAFLYDCRNCNNCLFCFNLRNKEYCIGNVQMTKEQYEESKKKWDFSTRSGYENAKENFITMMSKDIAWHRALVIDRSEACTGNFIDHSKGCLNCYFMDNSEDCINCVRSVSGSDKNCLDSIGHFNGELLCNSAIAQDQCYEVHHCFNVIQCKNLEYCGNCFQCKHCFGCSGLKGKEYCIFNTQYSEEEYENLRNQIIEKMKSTREYGKFFPGYFAPNPYDESFSAVHFPLDLETQKSLGFRLPETSGREKPEGALSIDAIPDNCDDADESLCQNVYWDDQAQKPFRISKGDIAFAKNNRTPLPHSFYARRLVENFRWMHYNGQNRQTTCGKSGKPIETNWPAAYDGRILSEEEYLQVIG